MNLWRLISGRFTFLPSGPIQGGQTRGAGKAGPCGIDGGHYGNPVWIGPRPAGGIHRYETREEILRAAGFFQAAGVPWVSYDLCCSILLNR